MDSFRNEDEAIGYWLARLRDGAADEQAAARTELALILERRGMVADAIEGYRANVAAGVRDRRSYDRLAAIYRSRGDALGEASVLEALVRLLRGTESQTMTALPTLSGADTTSGSPDAGPAEQHPAAITNEREDPWATDDVGGSPTASSRAGTRPAAAPSVPGPRGLDPLGQDGQHTATPAGPAYATAPRRGQRPIGRPVPNPGPRGGSMSPAAGILIALLGLLVLIGAVVFALLWTGGRIGGLNLGASTSGQAASGAADAGAPSGGPASGGAPTAPLAAGPAPTPTPAAPAASCWDPAVRFPESQQPADAVREALLEHLRRQDGTVDPTNPQVASLLDAHVQRADELVAGWMGVQLQRAQRRLPQFSLASYLGSELLVPNEAGQYTLRPTISEQGWREIQAWPTDTCEGAFTTRPENARWMSLMRASVGDISWAQAAPSPAASPSPAPR